MAYPKRTIVRSSILNERMNGRLPDSILETVPGQAGGAPVRLIQPAARAWRALAAAALAAGHVLKPTSASDSYRTYAIQESVFRDRYTTTILAGRPYRIWNGRRWYQRPNTAVAAVPGTSNHGWAAAVDVGEERDSDAGAESLDNPTLQWLLANEQRFGFFHSVDSEPWHIDYFAGDKIPAAVLEYEQSHGGESEVNLNDVVKRAGTPDHPDRTVEEILDDLWRGVHLKLETFMDEVRSRLTALEAKPTGVVSLSEEDRARIVAGLLGGVTPEIRDAVADLGEGGAAKVRTDAKE